MRLCVRVPIVAVASALVFFASLQFAFAQSTIDREWALFNQILIIGIGVGIVVFGLLFYAVIRYREKPQKPGVT